MGRDVSIHFQISYSPSSILFFPDENVLASELVKPCLQSVVQDVVALPPDLPLEVVMDHAAETAATRTTQALRKINLLLASVAAADHENPGNIQLRIFYGDIYGMDDAGNPSILPN